MVLGRNQDQARANGLGLRRAAERREDREDHGVGGEDAETDRGENGDAKNKWHNQRNHDRAQPSNKLNHLEPATCQPILLSPSRRGFYQMHGPTTRLPVFFVDGRNVSRLLKSNRIDALRC